jgi:hypothetical protein
MTLKNSHGCNIGGRAVKSQSIRKSFSLKKVKRKSKMEGRATWFCKCLERDADDETDLQEKALSACCFFGESRATGNTE